MSTNIGAMMIKIQIDDSQIGPKLTSIRQAMKLTSAASSKNFEEVGKNSESATDRSAKQSKVMTGLWQAGLTVISQLSSRVFSKVTSNIDGAVKRVDTLNNFPKVMQNFGISGLEASKMIKQLDIGVKGLPTSLNDIASLAQSFVPVTKNTEMATKTSLALNNALLAGGAVEQVRTSAMEQFRQALAKGKPELEDWKALETAMPAQLQQTAKALGLGTGALSAYSANGQGLYKAMKAGKITMDDFNNAMIKLNETGLGGFPSFAEQAKNATGGLQTSIANATTAITRGIGDIIQAIGTDVLGAAIGDSGKRFESVMKSIAGWIRDNHDAILKWVGVIKSNAIPTLTSFGAAMTAIKGLKIADSLMSDGGKIRKKFAETFQGVAADYYKHVGTAMDGDKLGKSLQKLSLGFRTVTKLITGVSFGPVTAGVIGVVSALTFLQTKFNIFGKLGKLIGDGLGKLKEVAGPAISVGLKTLGSIIDGVGKAIGGFASGIASGFSGVGKTVGEFASNFGKILKDVFPAFKPMVESFKTLFKTLGDSFNKIVQSIVKAFAPLMPAFAKLFGAIGKIFEQIFKVGSIIVTLVIGVIGAIAGAVGNVLMPIISVVVSVVSTIIGVVSGIVANIIGVVAQIIAVVVGIVAIIINIVANLISVIIGIVTGIISVIIGIVTTIINIVMGIITVIVNIISTIIGVVAGIISAIIGVVGAVIGVVVGIITTIVNVVSGIIGGIIGVVSAVVNTIVAVFQGIIGVITGIFNTIANAIGSIFRGIARTIGNIINGIVNIVKAPINFIIDGINGFIGGINKIKIPDWVPGVGGKGINLPKIPKLAVGGIVESATIAMIGESGREAVLPLDSNTGWINEVVDKLVDRMDGDKASPGGKTTINNNYEVHNDIDVELISRAQARMIRRLA